MREETPDRRLKHQLAELTGTKAAEWFLVNKARYGLEVVLSVIAEQRGMGEVITQPFTCLTAINPILHAGHVPVYAETSARTLSIDIDTAQVSDETKALIVQHSFGIPADMVACRAFADEHSLLLIEDSAHKLGLLAKERNKPLADISVHSFGVEKMLPTKFGAAVWINPALDETTQKAMRRAFQALPTMQRLASLRAKLYAPTNRILNHIPQVLGSHFFRSALTRIGVVDTPIAPAELRGKQVGKAAQPAVWMIKQALDALRHYDANMKRRARAGELYYNNLNKHETLSIPEDIQISEAMTRFPVICASAQQANELFTHLASLRLHPGKWYRPTLFPGPNNLAVYNYDPESCPIAENLSARILNLPTNVTLERAKEILDALNSY